jgi:hypothetical protein
MVTRWSSRDRTEAAPLIVAGSCLGRGSFDMLDVLRRNAPHSGADLHAGHRGHPPVPVAQEFRQHSTEGGCCSWRCRGHDGSGTDARSAALSLNLAATTKLRAHTSTMDDVGLT